MYDEKLSSLQALGGTINLKPWYSEDVSLIHMRFISTSQELLLIDSGGRARIFSLITQQCRYGITVSVVYTDLMLYLIPQACVLGLAPASARCLLYF